MKTILLCVGMIILTTQIAHTQTKLSTKNGTIDFEASVPSFEEVKGVNQNVSAILNLDSGEFAALALMTGFRFKVALMEEHFNENYVESSKYPKAVFKGNIRDFNKDGMPEGKSEWTIDGSLTLHGVTKELSVPISIDNSGDMVTLSTSFSVKPGDFDIDIPSVVSKKIAEEVQVIADFNLSQ